MNDSYKDKLKKLEEMRKLNIINDEEFRENKNKLIEQFLNNSGNNDNVSKEYSVTFKEKKQFFLFYLDFTIIVGNKKFKMKHGSELRLQLEEGIYEVEISASFRKTKFTLNLRSSVEVELSWNRAWGTLEHNIYNLNPVQLKNDVNFNQNITNNQYSEKDESMNGLVFLWFVIVPAWAIIFFFIYWAQGKTKKASQALLAILIEILLVIFAVNFT